MDLWGEWETRKAQRGTSLHKSGAVSSVLTTSIGPGWWKLSMSAAYRWLGPDTTSAMISTAVSSGYGQHEWSQAEAVFLSRETTAYVAFAPVVVAATTWYLDRVRAI